VDWKPAEPQPQPFRALIAALSLVIGVLYLAGFSYRWSYYYNFGAQHLVFGLNFQSFLIAAMEMIREPRNLVLTILSLLVSINLVNLLVRIFREADEPQNRGIFGKALRGFGQYLGFQNELVTDVIRAVVIVYVVYVLSSAMGYARFRQHAVNSPANTLPIVTVIVEREGKQDFILGCGQETDSLPNAIGDAKAVRVIQEAHRTCSLDTRVWRLLYRDDKSIYVFASDSADIIQNGRPLTIVIPNEKVSLVME
jgi:hypothetical protein